MAALPKYKRQDLDYNGLPAWLFQGTPASFEDEILKQGKFDETKAQLDATENVRNTIGNEKASEEDILKAIAAVRPEAALDVLRMGNREQDLELDSGYQDIQVANTLRALGGDAAAVRARVPGLFQGMTEEQVSEMVNRFNKPKEPKGVEPPKQEKADVLVEVKDPTSGATFRQYVTRSEFNQGSKAGVMSLVEKVAKEKGASVLDKIQGGPQPEVRKLRPIAR